MGWVEVLQQRSQQPTFSSCQHREGVYSVTWGPGPGDSLLLYTVGEGKIIQHNTKTGSFTDMQEMEITE